MAQSWKPSTVIMASSAYWGDHPLPQNIVLAAWLGNH